MKRAVARVKRKKAGTGAKRKAPRRAHAVKVAGASLRKSRKTTKRKKVLKPKAAKPRRTAAKRKIAWSKPRSKIRPTRRVRDKLASAISPSLVEESERGPELAEIVPAPQPLSVATKSPSRISQRKTATKAKSATKGVQRVKRTSRLISGQRVERRGPSRPVAQPKTSRAKTAPGAPVQGKIKPPKTPSRQLGLHIPAILLEGDEPELPVFSGPGEKFVLGPERTPAHFAAATHHLPASYGTGRLFLTARDPHWLYAHWDIHSSTQFQHNAKSEDRHLVLRMHEGDLHAKPVKEIHVHPESRHWFAHVEGADKQYVADLGYYRVGHNWTSLATSAPMRTPPETVSTDSTVQFATLPPELAFETILALLEEGEADELPLAHAIERLRARHRHHEFPPTERQAEWTPEQAHALAQLLAAGQSQPALRGSAEIPSPTSEIPFGGDWSAPPGEFNLSSFFGGESVSSPLGGGESAGRDFWFNVNAELIIYGSTEPGAKVSIGGKPIALRPDGFFSYRFALPDGKYELPIVAVSADDTDGRAADLKFARTTELYGDVGDHPQDPELTPPVPENV
jgi:uncharacterized protein